MQMSLEAKEVTGSPGAGVRVVSLLMWVLGVELRSSARVVHALDQWAVSPAPGFRSLDWTAQAHRYSSLQDLKTVAVYL